MESEKEYYTKSNEYYKKYYDANKDRIKEQIKKAQQKRSVEQLIEKLNSDEKFERFPYSRIKKHGIKYDKETNTYSL